ncbi:aminotransferase class V-fold PLP-dependent enzyme [Rhodobacteraceae bacterium]|nr:aminotransferase class V-fold PLP-dependent enzyme [Paracoccaceae bacterium]
MQMSQIARSQFYTQIIGHGMEIETPFGTKPLIYADYTASGRALVAVERFISETVLPVYSNSHTQASFCGRAITRLREAAREIVARETGAGSQGRVVFCANGATAGINRICALAGVAARVAAGARVRVLVGPYEHHSNILPWRESGAEVVEIAESPAGGPDLGALAQALDVAADLTIGAFSAASNVTGRISDVVSVTRLLKAAGALAIWDYACAGPYLPMSLTPASDAPIDAIVASPHKFLGGPGASGVLVVREDSFACPRPTQPGGGTVSFVSPWAQVYSPSIIAREEPGTPDTIGDIRAALAFLVKARVGTDYIARHDETLRQRALQMWGRVENLRLLGQEGGVPALPVFSVQITGARGRQVHPQLVARILSDCYGIQARGGCACAGPYAHRLLGIDHAQSARIMAALARGEELEKPGWTRLNLSWCHSAAEVDQILEALCDLAAHADTLAARYHADPATARFEFVR